MRYWTGGGGRITMNAAAEASPSFGVASTIIPGFISLAFFRLTVLLALIALSGAAYYYLGMREAGSEPLPPAATPDNNVIAGPVASVGAGSITIMKQDGTSATLGISEDTRIVAAGSRGQPGAPKSAGDIQVGMIVLATPSESDASIAASLVLVPAPPAL